VLCRCKLVWLKLLDQDGRQLEPLMVRVAARATPWRWAGGLSIGSTLTARAAEGWSDPAFEMARVPSRVEASHSPAERQRRPDLRRCRCAAPLR
jgi:hypothetical protein